MSCPLCGANGFELFSRFECERPGCRNYAMQPSPQNRTIGIDFSPPRPIGETPPRRLVTRQEFEAAERVFSRLSVPVGPDGSCIVTDARGRQDRVGWNGADPDFEALDGIADHLCAGGFTSPVTITLSREAYHNLLDEMTVGTGRRVGSGREVAACAALEGGIILWSGAVDLRILPGPREEIPPKEQGEIRFRGRVVPQRVHDQVMRLFLAVFPYRRQEKDQAFVYTQEEMDWLDQQVKHWPPAETRPEGREKRKAKTVGDTEDS